MIKKSCIYNDFVKAHLCSGPLVDRGFACLYIGLIMFVRLVKKPNDHVSVRIVENKREGKKVKQKTICCVGHTHKDNIEKIQTFKKWGDKLIRDMKEEMQGVFSGIPDSYPPENKFQNKFQNKFPEGMVHAKSLKEEGRVSKGCSDIFGIVYDQLNLLDFFGKGIKQKQVCELLKEISLCRLEFPVSKRRSVKDIKRRKDRDIFLDRVYRMMDKVYERSEEIKGRICERTMSLIKERVDVVFFDVTTLYFESFISDELKRPGFSKDNKVKESQVVLALMTTSDGLPLGYELYPGNVYEGGTLIQVVESMSKSYDVRDMLLVADRGLFSSFNFLELEKRGVKFIVGSRLRSLRVHEKEKILSEAPGFLKSGGLRRKENWRGEYDKGGFRLIVNYDKRRAKKDKADREKVLAKMREKMGSDGRVSLMDVSGNKAIRKYLKLERKGIKRVLLNEEKVKEEALWDGFSGVITNHRLKKADEIIERYRDLWQIEAAFRLNKHDLKMRPIYHWTPKRIKAHILICFIVYALACFVRYRLKKSHIKLSFERIREELSSVQFSIVRDTKTGRRFLLPSKATAMQKTIYKLFNKKLNQTVQFL